MFKKPTVTAENKVQKQLRKALDSLGSHGEHWAGPGVTGYTAGDRFDIWTAARRLEEWDNGDKVDFHLIQYIEAACWALYEHPAYEISKQLNVDFRDVQEIYELAIYIAGAPELVEYHGEIQHNRPYDRFRSILGPVK